MKEVMGKRKKDDDSDYHSSASLSSLSSSDGCSDFELLSDVESVIATVAAKKTTKSTSNKVRDLIVALG